MPGPIHPKRERAALSRRLTLAELAVVVVLIVVLAAIAVPTFLSQRADGQDDDARAEVTAAAATAESWFAVRHTYAGAGEAIRRNVPSARFGYLRSDPAGGYFVTVRSEAGGGSAFTIERRPDGSRTYYCAARGRGRCPSDHDWNASGGTTDGQGPGLVPPATARYVIEAG